MKKRSIYDTTAPNKSTKIIEGQSSNVLNWDDVRLDFAYPLYKIMLGNFWIASEINMTTDVKNWKKDLTPDERESFKKIIGLLAFLDSVQTDFVGRVADYVTDSSIVALLQVIGFQEVIHNESYSYVLSSLVPKHEQDEIFDYWRHDKVLLERNQFIADGYEEFTNNPSPDSFRKALVYDVILEGLFFYSAFAFFYNLARNQKMVSTSTMLSYINRDEQHHVRLFANVYKTLLEDYPELDTDANRAWATETFRKAAALEAKWGKYIIGNRFEGIDEDSLQEYIEFMANKRANEMGLDKPFEHRNNPFKWITAYENANASKSDFFEQKPRSYAKVSEDNGFDDL
jgi:ribonucleoside-diphosphate reductase beta chain